METTNNQGTPEVFPFLSPPYKAFLFPCLPLSLFAKHEWWWLTPLLQQALNKYSSCFGWSLFHNNIRLFCDFKKYVYINGLTQRSFLSCLHKVKWGSVVGHIPSTLWSCHLKMWPALSLKQETEMEKHTGFQLPQSRIGTYYISQGFGQN